MDSLELAVHCKCKKFVSNSTVQSILDNIWNGTRNDSLEEVLALFRLFNFNLIFIFKTDRERELKNCQAQYNNNRRYV